MSKSLHCLDVYNNCIICSAMEPETEFDHVSMAESRIQLGRKLIEDLRQFADIDGVTKVQRKINQEIQSLQKVGEMIRSPGKLNCTLVGHSDTHNHFALPEGGQPDDSTEQCGVF